LSFESLDAEAAALELAAAEEEEEEEEEAEAEAGRTGAVPSIMVLFSTWNLALTFTPAIEHRWIHSHEIALPHNARCKHPHT
jgi:hypothetical protein